MRFLAAWTQILREKVYLLRAHVSVSAQPLRNVAGHSRKTIGEGRMEAVQSDQSQVRRSMESVPLNVAAKDAA
jgi:hypothetical protein